MSQAPDGTRVNDKGEPWIPPAGNGISYAVKNQQDQNIYAGNKESLSSSPTASASAPASASAVSASSPPSTAIVSPSTADATSADKATAGEGLPNGDKGENGGIEGLTKGTKDLNMNGGGELKGDTGPVPEAKTAAGPPESVLKFDHPPTESEKEMVKQ